MKLPNWLNKKYKLDENGIFEIMLDNRLFNRIKEGKKDFVIITEKQFYKLKESIEIIDERSKESIKIHIPPSRYSHRRITIGDDFISIAYSSTFFWVIVKGELKHLLDGDEFKTELEFRDYYMDKFKNEMYGINKKSFVGYLVYFKDHGPVPYDYENTIDWVNTPNSACPSEKPVPHRSHG